MGRRTAVTGFKTKIEYRCDLTSPEGDIIPLGFMVELHSAGARALGLVARTELGEDEMQKVGQLARHLMKNPFDHISEQFDEAWDNTTLPGEALRYLAESNCHSIHFEVPKPLEVPDNLIGADEAKLGQFLLDVLTKHRRELVPSVLGSPVGGPVPARQLLELDAAA